jgi:subtilase family serine protease
VKLPITVLAVAAATTACLGGATASAAPGTLPAIRVCGPTGPGHAACQAQVVAHANGIPAASGGPSGLNPADIQGAYQLSGKKSGGRTVAIVDAYDDPSAQSDLSVYRARFGLPACTTANGCFHKVNQTGGTRYPRKDAGWAAEISLDLDMVSATCPDCRILLVEASSSSFADLAAGVNYAAGRRVAAISNSYGGSDRSQNAAYNHPGIAITASTGDSGYGVASPASYGSVIAVGGTSLSRASGTSRGCRETAWSGAGSGCSRLNSKPSWQTSATRCSGKAVADVSAVADPATGVSVYDTTFYQGAGGWMVFGGTSASSPIVASVYALGGNLSGYPAAYTWRHASSLVDVTSGSNGACSPSVWCRAGTGWDGPTGLGTPKGTAAF